MRSLTIAEIISKSLSRSKRWHETQQPWTTSDWATALAGEGGELSGAILGLIVAEHVGELCNAVKKLRRIETGAPNINLDPGRQISSREEAILKIGQEMADILLYMPSLANELGIDLEANIKVTFNTKSIEYGFPERLGREDAQ